jgi:hypothetical protein
MEGGRDTPRFYLEPLPKTEREGERGRDRGGQAGLIGRLRYGQTKEWTGDA